MTITVTVPAQSFDLTTIDVVRKEFNITDSNSSEDENLSRWIRQASNAVAEYCNRVFAKETLLETVRLAAPADNLVLARFPVSSITSVVENDVTLTAADYEIASESGVLTRLSNDTPVCWPSGKVVIEYVAGFELLTTLPHAVERACVQLVAQYRSGAGRDPQLRSEQVEGISSAGYFDGAEDGGLSPEVRGLLAPFKSYRVG